MLQNFGPSVIFSVRICSRGSLSKTIENIFLTHDESGGELAGLCLKRERKKKLAKSLFFISKGWRQFKPLLLPWLQRQKPPWRRMLTFPRAAEEARCKCVSVCICSEQRSLLPPSCATRCVSATETSGCCRFTPRQRQIRWLQCRV